MNRSKSVGITASETLNQICGLDLERRCLEDTFEPTEIIPVTCPQRWPFRPPGEDKAKKSR